MKIKSHGLWHAVEPKVPGFLWFENDAGLCWYDYQRGRTDDPATVKILVRDGHVVMRETAMSRIVPPGEVFEAPAGIRVESGWLWRGNRFEPPPKADEDPLAKLAAFLRANPDVRALLD